MLYALRSALRQHENPTLWTVSTKLDSLRRLTVPLILNTQAGPSLWDGHRHPWLYRGLLYTTMFVGAIRKATRLQLQANGAFLYCVAEGRSRYNKDVS